MANLKRKVQALKANLLNMSNSLQKDQLKLDMLQ